MRLRPLPPWIVTIALVVALCTHATEAHAQVNFGQRLARIISLRDLGESLGQGLGEGVREQVQTLIRNDIDPLIGRIDMMIRNNIDHGADRIERLLTLAEASLNRLLDRSFAGARALLAEAREMIHDVDRAIAHAVCQVAPTGEGISVQIPAPFACPMDRVRVSTPARSRCWAEFVRGGDPSSMVFDGANYYRGMMCEREFELAQIDPYAPAAFSQIVALYRDLQRLAARSYCATPDSDRPALLARQARYAARAVFFSNQYRVQPLFH